MSYTPAYYLAWLNAAIGVVAGAIAAGYLVVHPAWLTSDVAGTCAVIVPISIGLASLLPPITRTPAAREAEILLASQQVLPKDLAQRHPLILAATEVEVGPIENRPLT